jgi:hypothetical protein
MSPQLVTAYTRIEIPVTAYTRIEKPVAAFTGLAVMPMYVEKSLGL